MAKYMVIGCIQGRGFNADKFYDVADEYEAESFEEAKEKAQARGVWVEKVFLQDEEQ